MKNVAITVGAKHLKGNDYGTSKRGCPLQEAMEDSGYKDFWVSAQVVFQESSGKVWYKIDPSWNKKSVEEAIKIANTGTDISVIVNLTYTV